MGLRRSGTNFLNWLIDENFEGVQTLGLSPWHKHNVPPDPDELEPFVDERGVETTEEMIQSYRDDQMVMACVGKNVFSFYFSFVRNYHDINGWYSEEFKPEVVERWNEKTDRFLSFLQDYNGPSHFFRYENLLENTKTELDIFGEGAGLGHTGDVIQKPKYRVNRTAGQTNKGFNPSIYTEQIYIQKMGEGTCKKIDDLKDNNTANRFFNA